MERLPSRIVVHAAAALAAISGLPGGLGFFGSRGPRPKPAKICCNKGCRKEHFTGLPCCSAECHAAWKRGDDTPVEPTQLVEVVFDDQGNPSAKEYRCLPLTDAADAATTKPTSPT